MEKLLAIIEDLRCEAILFRPMDDLDWQAFAGADQGSQIAFGEKYTFILSPSGVLDAIDEHGHEITLTLKEVC